MKRLFIYLSLGASISITSYCKKYEEGPRVSLASKKARVANTWKLDKKFENDKEIALSNSDMNLRYTLTKEGVATRTSGNFTQTGTWAFVNDKEELNIIFPTQVFGTTIGTENRTYQILRLKNDELWIEYRDNSNDVWEYHWVDAD